jgi:regulatory protein
LRSRRRPPEPDDEGRALAYALRLLSYRGRSERELAERLLARGFTARAAAAAVERARALGYVDDGALARTLRRTAEEVKLLGAMGAARYLRRMGLTRETAEEALLGYDEAESARKLLRRKSRSLRGADEASRRRRLAGMLLRRGHSAPTVRKALESYEDDPDNTDREEN